MMKLRSLALAAALASVAVTISAAPALAVVPPNDDIANATPITAIPFQDVLDTTEATEGPTDQSCSGSGSTVWYTITLPSTVWVEVNTQGSGYDTTLQAFTGLPDALEMFDCNDDYYGVQSRLVFEAQAGVTYHVMIGVYGGGTGGPTVFNAFEAPPPPPPFDLTLGPISGTVVGKTGVATLRATVGCNTDGYVYVEGRLQERIGRAYISAYFSDAFECTSPSLLMEVPVRSSEGLFVAGKAALTYLYVEGCNETGCDSEYLENVEIKLRGA